jgi:hypothetical protein
MTSKGCEDRTIARAGLCLVEGGINSIMPEAPDGMALQVTGCSVVF